MRVAIIGSRDFVDYDRFLEGIGLMESVITEVISGEARGADTLAKKYAAEKDIPFHGYPADWEKHGRSAGYIRNVDIVSNSDAVIAFWDGVSKGTRHSLNLAKQQKKPTLIIYV